MIWSLWSNCQAGWTCPWGLPEGLTHTTGKRMAPQQHSRSTRNRSPSTGRTLCSLLGGLYDDVTTLARTCGTQGAWTDLCGRPGAADTGPTGWAVCALRPVAKQSACYEKSLSYGQTEGNSLNKTCDTSRHKETQLMNYSFEDYH